MESVMGQFKFSLFSAVPENGVFASRETSGERKIPLPLSSRNNNQGGPGGRGWHPRVLRLGPTPMLVLTRDVCPSPAVVPPTRHRLPTLVNSPLPGLEDPSLVVPLPLPWVPA